MISASLAVHQAVDLGDRAVGQLLHLVERAALVVLGDLLVLEQLLQRARWRRGAGCAPRSWRPRRRGARPWSGRGGAPRSARGIGTRSRSPCAAGFRPRSDSRMAFSIFGAHALFPGLHADRARIEQRHVGHLADRHHRAVVVDVHLVEDARVGAAGADLLQFVLEAPRSTWPSSSRRSCGCRRCSCRPHSLAVRRGPACPRPRPAPRACSAPGLKIENTLIGSFWSRHSANAVASITCRLLARSPRRS